MKLMQKNFPIDYISIVKNMMFPFNKDYTAFKDAKKQLPVDYISTIRNMRFSFPKEFKDITSSYDNKISNSYDEYIEKRAKISGEDSLGLKRKYAVTMPDLSEIMSYVDNPTEKGNYDRRKFKQ